MAPGETTAWADFAYEHREYNERMFRRAQQAITPTSIAEVDRNMERNWHALDAGQRSYYLERSKKLVPSPGINKHEHRAFWCFYYDMYYSRLESRGNDPHVDIVTTEAFTDETIFAWQRMKHWHKTPFIHRIASGIDHYPIPFIPGYREASLHQFQPGKSSSPPVVKGEETALSAPPAATPETQGSESSGSRSLSQEPLQSDQEEDPEPAQTQGSQAVQEEDAVRLSMTELFSGRTSEELEKSVDRGVEMLQQIRQTLGSQPSQDSSQWLQTIDNVQKQAIRTKTVVGVVGPTGAGKSFVINAMLDEERLVPTNCMRACTAVVTEISNNQEDIQYRAEVEFIGRQDWAKELRVLFQDLLDGSGEVSRECTNEESDAGVAYAKIRAVYPRLTREDMKNATIDYLMQHGNVNCLGTDRKLENDDPLVFYKKLQHYVDSKEKSTAKDKNDKEKRVREMEFWPLIKVVRLYVKAPALATGAVIVDLPGVHDSNQARAAVAQNYMKACTGLWIVAPITRAVDDKSAKTLC